MPVAQTPVEVTQTAFAEKFWTQYRVVKHGSAKVKPGGSIILTASSAASNGTEAFSVYAASKAYVRSFGEALAQELKDTGVIVNVLCPGATATNFMAVAGGTPSGLQAHRMMSADAVARIGYAGMARGQRVTVTGLLNRLLAFAAIHTPHFVTLPATAKTLARD